MKFLGIDHGLKRIGLAVSDSTGLIARELSVIKRTSIREDFERINRVIEEQRVDAIIVGLPHNDQAHAGEYTQADTVRRWVERFAQTTDRPIRFWDEQLTSHDAREIAIRQRRKIGEPIDDLAARLTLQSFLDAVRDGLVTPILNNDAGSDTS